MRRCVIVGGSHITNYNEIKNRLRQDDFFVFCDGGLEHAAALGRRPDLIVGDFDSFDQNRLAALGFDGIETIKLPREKDDTDTVFAAKEALSRGFDEFLLIGVIGKRLDHTLGNTSLLLMLHNAGAKASVIDDYSEMEIAGDAPVYVEDKYSYFSLLNIFGPVSGVYISDAKYPLDGAEISCDYQYGISNEVIPNKKACIRVTEGKLLLVKVF